MTELCLIHHRMVTASHYGRIESHGVVDSIIDPIHMHSHIYPNAYLKIQRVISRVSGSFVPSSRP